MNRTIARYFDEVEARLIASPAVVTYRVSRREVTPGDGKMRVKANLSDGGMAELFEYVIESGGQLVVHKYSFHWQDARENLVRRWDNAPHHPEMIHAPYHLHHSDESVVPTDGAMDMFQVIEEIEKSMAG